MTEKEKAEIKAKIAQFFIDTNAQFVPEEEYQDGLKKGVPLICSRFSTEGAELSKEIFSSKLSATMIGQCAVCDLPVMYGQVNQDATRLICIDCFMEHHQEIMKDQKGEVQ